MDVVVINVYLHLLHTHKKIFIPTQKSGPVGHLITVNDAHTARDYPAHEPRSRGNSLVPNHHLPIINRIFGKFPFGHLVSRERIASVGRERIACQGPLG